jgi:cytoskeletal protein CcmA (bactofilin family)
MGKSAPPPSPQIVNLIGKSTFITGDITTDGDIRIDGKLTGNLISKQKVVIGATGKVKGETTCNNCEVFGKLEGKIKVKDTLSLKDTSVFTGEMHTGKLAIEAGAVFSGSCTMGSMPVPNEEKGKK